MIQHYFKIACRNLLKYKVQNILSIVGLSIGFTAFLLGGYWHHWEYHFVVSTLKFKDLCLDYHRYI